MTYTSNLISYHAERLYYTYMVSTSNWYNNKSWFVASINTSSYILRQCLKLNDVLNVLHIFYRIYGQFIFLFRVSILLKDHEYFSVAYFLSREALCNNKHAYYLVKCFSFEISHNFYVCCLRIF